MSKVELKDAIEWVEEWSARLESDTTKSLKAGLELVLAAARSTIEPPEKAEIEILREALRPFANCAEFVKPDTPNEEWCKFNISAKCYRDAGAALKTGRPSIPTVEFNGHNQDAEPDSGTIYVPLMTGQISVGRLGAKVPDGSLFNNQLIAALDMAERRILRLEMALRRSGVEVELVELPE